uniref:PLATZ transcription factor family protein, putative n=1 Tax=Tanacetum cinerariifolium TaxID=118510 RepID=A0A6L2N928_TANCI|nr:PLATZ transcription factor family protein, putative [Tanacetum cinerariifolium]
MADLTINTTTSTGGCGSNGFKRQSRKQNKHVELSPWIVDMINIIEPKDCSMYITHKLDRFCIKCIQLFCNECSSSGHDGHEHLQVWCRKAHYSGSDRLCSFRLMGSVSGDIIGSHEASLRPTLLLEYQFESYFTSQQAPSWRRKPYKLLTLVSDTKLDLEFFFRDSFIDQG